MIGKNPYLSPYPESTGEIDLREEFNRTLYGAPDEIKKGTIGILRKMRRDSSGNLIRCTCRNTLTDEQDKDYHCSKCHSMGYYWDERYVTYRVNQEAYKRIEDSEQEYGSYLFYLEYNIDVTDADYIISIRNDKNGNVIIPVERLVIYKIYNAEESYGDNGRVEFITVRSKEQTKWSVWNGVKHRQYG